FFKNRVVWITGASSGIGREIALQLSERGSHLILTSSSAEKLEKVKQECKVSSSAVHVVTADLTRADSIEPLTEKVTTIYNRLDVVILNAGISQRALISESDFETHRKIFQINYFSNVQIVQRILPLFLEQGYGHLAVTSSITGKFGFPLRSAYSASKHALHGFFETLHLEHLHDNIFVTIAMPGRVRTDISLNALDASGQKHGKLDPGQANGISAEKCAEKYIEAIEKQKMQVLIGGKEIWMVHIRRFLPRLFYKIARKISTT
ncbi:MAG: SDR family oxidoreductase, partial [Bacteroidota bacterium]